MKKGKLLKATSLALAGLLVLSGCGKAADNKAKSEKGLHFDTSVKNEGKPVENAKPITIGLVLDTPLKGQFNPVFFFDAEEREAILEAMLGAFPTDKLFALQQDNENAMFQYHLDKENKNFTIAAHKDLKWSDGTPVTAEDIMATYKLMGNPKFESNIRYDENYEVIVGMKEYHEGQANDISGMKKVDDKTVKFELKEVKPTMLWGDGTTIVEMLPAKQIAEITDFSKFWEYPLNTKPLSYGPYYLEKNNGGQSLLFKANPYYYLGEPKNKEYKVEIVPPSQLVEKLKSGAIDIMKIPSTKYPEVSKLTNGKVLGIDDLYMGYIGFKLGKYDATKGENVVDPNAKLADINLRKAMAMALDNDAVNKKFFNDIGVTPTGSGLFPPIREGVYSDKTEGWKYDVEGAKKILDEAGYKDVDGDGYREDKNGKKLVINLAQRNSGNEIDEPWSQFYIQSFKAIGLNVQLNDGKLMGSGDFAERVKGDDPSIDLFVGAWGLASSPFIDDLLGKKAIINLYRYTSDKLQTAIDKTKSSDAWDKDKLLKDLQELDVLLKDELAYIPTRWTRELTYVNNRIAEYTVDPFDETYLNSGDKIANVGLLSESPMVSK